ncbi:BT4734/BF3469 family protein [Treponema sp.]|uniref:BT4734/BF3469 family protein n=1 Tax=Treponema sp. TaxID=166 RepID=UPI003FD851F8
MKYDDIKNSIISYCYGSYDKTTYDISIDEALNEIKQEKYSQEVNKYRMTQEKSIKNSLKAYIFSGNFSRDENTAVQSYYNICILDFDKIKDDINNVKDFILRCDYVFAAWISPSGKGVKALIYFDISNFEISNVLDYVELHKMAYKQFLKQDFFNPYILDSTGSNISRLCFTSIDSNLVIKENIIPFAVSKEEKKHKDKNIKKTKRNIQEKKKISENEVKFIPGHKSNYCRYIYNSIYKYLRKRNISITESYNDWYLIGQAIANTFSYSIGKDYYLKLCRLDGDKHDEEKSVAKIIECYKQSQIYTDNKVGMTTIIKAAQKKGWTHKGIQEY